VILMVKNLLENYSNPFDLTGAITPVPGGVGPMTIACLLRNTLTAFARINNQD